jgi:hypothetical protein
VWLRAGGLSLDDGASVPPPSENPLCPWEEEGLRVDCAEPEDDDAAVAGCPCRTRTRVTAKPAAAVRVTARFAALARLRPASTLDPDMASLSRTSLRAGWERVKRTVRTGLPRAGRH